jgi:O-methyltransferase domain
MANTNDPKSDRAELDILLRGFQISRMLCLVADLGLADRIAPDKEMPVRQLALDCGVLAAPLLRVLRALAAVHVFRLSVGGDVGHTPRSRLLRTDTPNSLHYSARFWTSRGSWRAWETLEAALTGGVPHEAAWSTGRFDYLRTHQEEARIYDNMMAHFPDDRHAAIAASYDFSSARLICDIGGGTGETLRHILSRFSGTRGVIYDRPDVIASVPTEQLSDGRIRTEAGDFFARVPHTADHYLLVRVLHNWSDVDCERIMRAARAAMEPGARLLVVDQILNADPANGELQEYLIDTQMMAMFGDARVRTEAEFRILLADTGFTPRGAIATSSPVSIIEAIAT